MYLEMLQQIYGAALEKQAMEKQALNPMQLVQMGRRFVGRGKMDRFNQLLNKRNAAIRKVGPSRLDKVRDVHDPAYAEREWLGHADGPVNRQYRSALRRFVDPQQPEGERMSYLRDKARGYVDEHKRYIESLSRPYTTSTIGPQDLSGLSAYLRQHGY